MPDESELERSVEQVGEQARTRLNQEHEALESKLRDFEAKSRDAQERYQNKKKLEDSRIRSDGEAARGAGLGLTIAYTILGFPLVGFGVGYLLDQSLKSGNTWQSILGLTGSVLGVVGAVILLNRQSGSAK